MSRLISAPPDRAPVRSERSSALRRPPRKSARRAWSAVKSPPAHLGRWRGRSTQRAGVVLPGGGVERRPVRGRLGQGPPQSRHPSRPNKPQRPEGRRRASPRGLRACDPPARGGPCGHPRCGRPRRRRQTARAGQRPGVCRRARRSCDVLLSDGGQVPGDADHRSPVFLAGVKISVHVLKFCAGAGSGLLDSLLRGADKRLLELCHALRVRETSLPVTNTRRRPGFRPPDRTARRRTYRRRSQRCG